VTGGTMRVGVTPDDPWVRLGEPTPAGVEVRLVQGLAAELDADIEWVPGSESELMDALHVRALDLVIGGLDSAAPWSKEASLTRHYLVTREVVAVPSGPPGPREAADLDGVRVAVERGRAAVERVRSFGVIPVAVDDVAQTEGPVVVDDWRVESLGLTALDAEVTRSEHVMAVPLGENGWQTTVERHLLTRPTAELVALLRSEQS
jgi:polar amino acid transport system substrate-binding protein